MFKQGQRNRAENITTLKKVVDKLGEVFDARDLYHHSSKTEICELAYFYDGRKEGFSISFMGTVIYESLLEDYYDDTFGIIDFDNFEEIYQQCYSSILNYYSRRCSILNWSEISQSEKEEIKEILTDELW